MGHHSKTLISFVSVIAMAVGVVMFFGNGYRGQPPLWHMLLSTSLIVSGLCGTAVVAWMMLRKDRAPDFLRRMVKEPFECAGLCFVPTIEAIDGIVWLTVFFQNRYSRPCVPAIRFLAQGVRWRIEPIEFAADGAEFGVFRRAVNVPDDLRGRTVLCVITGRNHYPDGRGRMLRFRDGLVVGRWNDATVNTLVTVAAAVSGHIHIDNTAQVKFELPGEASTIDEIEHPDVIESLWAPHLE